MPYRDTSPQIELLALASDRLNAQFESMSPLAFVAMRDIPADFGVLSWNDQVKYVLTKEKLAADHLTFAHSIAPEIAVVPHSLEELLAGAVLYVAHARRNGSRFLGYGFRMTEGFLNEFLQQHLGRDFPAIRYDAVDLPAKTQQVRRNPMLVSALLGKGVPYEPYAEINSDILDRSK